MGVIYQASNLSPKEATIDLTQNQDFTATINGVKATHYQIKIWDIATDTLKYDTTKVALTPNLSNGDAFTYNYLASSPQSLVNNDEYKWILTIWNDSDYATTREIPFYAYTDPVVTFSPPTNITAQSHTFTASYSQSEGIELDKWKMNLYQGGEIIETSDWVIDYEISYLFEGFVNGESYGIELLGYNVNNVSFNTGQYSFDVSYSQPSVSVTPGVTVDNDTSFVNINWGALTQITGEITSGSTAYISGLDGTSGKALSLDNNDQVEFEFNITEDFSVVFLLEIPDTSIATKMTLYKDVDYSYEFGWEDNRFFVIINGVKIWKYISPIIGKTYFVCLNPTEFFIKEVI